MPSQVPPVAAAVEVPGSPVVGNPYTILDGTKIVVDRIDEEDSLHHIFYWIGFKIEDHIVLLAEYVLDLFSDVIMLTDKEISTMSSGFATITQGNYRFNFGIRRTKYLKAPVHWVQDLYSTS